MLQGLTFLLIFQLAGEMASYLLGGIIPGPVIGMLLVFAALALTRQHAAAQSFHTSTEATAGLLIANLGVLFVPAAVGVGQHLDILASHGAALLATIIASTAFTLIATVWAFVLAKRLLARAP
ncbi:MAG: CidA/LrgA family protein [Alphaproteobacteria bacterium]|nr:CidA/LrgA family protein [Alphaproteobacteria bacterium]